MALLRPFRTLLSVASLHPIPLSSRCFNQGAAIRSTAHSLKFTANRRFSSSSTSSPHQHQQQQLQLQLFTMTPEAMMHHLHKQNTLLFRSLLLLLTLSVGAGIATFVFWPDVRTNVVEQTSAVVEQVLNEKELRMQATTFAKEVVSNILSDETVSKKAFHFIQSILSSQETHVLITDVLAQTLRNQTTREELQKVVDTATKRILSEPTVRQELIKLLQWTGAQHHTQELVGKLLIDSIASTHVKAAGKETLSTAANGVLNDEVLRKRLEVYLHDILEDDALRRKGGDFLWKAYKYSVTPRWGAEGGGGGGGGGGNGAVSTSETGGGVGGGTTSGPSEQQQQSVATVVVVPTNATEEKNNTSHHVAESGMNSSVIIDGNGGNNVNSPDSSTIMGPSAITPNQDMQDDDDGTSAPSYSQLVDRGATAAALPIPKRSDITPVISVPTS